MKSLIMTALAVLVAGCSAKLPADRFPASLEVKRTLYTTGGFGFRETCLAIVAELTEDSARKLDRVAIVKGHAALVAPSGWKTTPIVADGQDNQDYYRGALGGCSEDGDGPLGDLPGSLRRPGALYKILDGGQGIAIIVPRAKLAGYFYAG